jgi:hypothetical protein
VEPGGFMHRIPLWKADSNKELNACIPWHWQKAWCIHDGPSLGAISPWCLQKTRQLEVYSSSNWWPETVKWMNKKSLWVELVGSMRLCWSELILAAFDLGFSSFGAARAFFFDGFSGTCYMKCCRIWGFVDTFRSKRK